MFREPLSVLGRAAPGRLLIAVELRLEVWDTFGVSPVAVL